MDSNMIKDLIGVNLVKELQKYLLNKLNKRQNNRVLDKLKKKMDN